MNFNQFQDKLMDFLTEDPNFCVYNGIEKNLGALPNPGKNHRISRQGKLKMLKNTHQEISIDNLSSDEKINHTIAGYFLEQARLGTELDLDGVPHDMRMPQAAQWISGPIFMFFINDPREPKFRLVNIISRLEKVDEFITSYCKNLHGPVERWVNMEIEKIKGLPDFFENIKVWAKEVKFKNIDRLEKAINSANNALKRYEQFLNTTSKTTNIFVGEKQMLEVLNSRGIEKTPKELKEIAQNFLEQNKLDVEALRKKLVEKYGLDENTTAGDLQKFLAEKFKVKRTGEGFDYILKRYESEREKILSYIKKDNLFPVMEDQDMHLMQTPDFMKPSIPAGAMMPHLPLREGVKKSLVYLTLSEDLVDEHTEISIPGMMIHEGIPGHHLQFAWSACNEHIIRRVFGANDLHEGWTTMLEDYMLDIGYAGELEDEIRFSGKRDIARIGARVAIDLFFMSGDKSFLEVGVDCELTSDDPFICAGNLLAAVTGFVPDRVQGELNWYSQEKGYPLSYLTGNFLVWDLKEKFKQKYSNQFRGNELEKEFHHRFLNAGNMPMSLLEKVLLD